MTTWDNGHKPAWFTLFSSDLQALDTGGSSPTGYLPGKVLSTVAGAVGQYFETHCDLITVPGGATNCAAIGIANLSADLSRGFDDGNSFGWYADGWFLGPGGFAVSTGVGFATGDQLGVEWNSGGFKFYKGATLIYTYTGTLPAGDLFAAMYLVKNPDEVTANFGATTFANPPSGVTGWVGSTLTARNITFAKTLPGVLHFISLESGAGPPPPPAFGTGGFFPDAIAEYLAGRTIICDYLAFFDFATMPMRLWQGFGTLHTLDGFDWSGIGQLGSIGDLESSIGGTSPTATFTLSVVDPTLLADTLDAESEIYGRIVKVFMQLFNTDFTPLDNPYVVWAGLMDQLHLKQRMTASGEEINIEMSAETIFARRSLPPLGNYTDREQQILYPGDTSLSIIPSLTNKTAIWPVILPGYP